MGKRFDNKRRVIYDAVNVCDVRYVNNAKQAIRFGF